MAQLSTRVRHFHLCQGGMNCHEKTLFMGSEPCSAGCLLKHLAMCSHVSTMGRGHQEPLCWKGFGSSAKLLQHLTVLSDHGSPLVNSSSSCFSSFPGPKEERHVTALADVDHKWLGTVCSIFRLAYKPLDQNLAVY